MRNAWTVVAILFFITSIALAEEGDVSKSRQQGGEAADNVAKRPVRILWTGASFVPAETTSLVATVLSTEKTGMKVIDSRKLYGSPSALVKNPAAFQEGKFDFVVLNDKTLAVVRDKQRIARSKEAIGEAIKIIRDAGATPILYCTWLRATPRGGSAASPFMTKDFDTFANYYEGLAKKHDVCIAPIGHAWKTAWRERSEESLRLYSGDKNHASHWGLYLNACVMYCVVTGKSPTGDTSFQVKTDNDKKTASFLQSVAWKTFLAQRKRKELKVCVLD